MMNLLKRRSLALLLALTLGAGGCATNPSTGGTTSNPIGPDKVVYHLNAGLEQATN